MKTEFEIYHPNHQIPVRQFPVILSTSVKMPVRPPERLHVPLSAAAEILQMFGVQATAASMDEESR